MLTLSCCLLSTDQEWKHSCYIHCLAPVLDAISQPSLNYETVMDLDNRIRDFSIPSHLRDGGAHPRSIVMQKASLSTALEAGMSPPSLPKASSQTELCL